MTPDQLPAGLRVKALEWDFLDDMCEWIAGEDHGYTVWQGTDGNWYTNFEHEANLFQPTACPFHDSAEAAKAACQRRRDELVCAQLEIVNG